MTTTAQERNAQAARQARVGQGARAEQTAAAFLRGRGLRLLARNYRAPGGEIDLIAEEAGTLVFVEVRLRSGTRHGGALESIDRPKRRRIVLAARHYLAQRRGAEPPCRFDVVLLMPVRTGRAGSVTGIAHEIVGIHDARSLAEGYNRGAARARGLRHQREPRQGSGQHRERNPPHGRAQLQGRRLRHRMVARCLQRR